MTTTPTFSTGPADSTQSAEAELAAVPVAEGGTAPSRPGAAVAGVATQRVPVRHEIHGVPEAASSLLMTIVVALFVLTFVAQPMVIPSESMERTLLVGDFLLVNRSALAPGGMWQGILPYAQVQRGEIVTFHSPLVADEFLVKRVIGMPGDRLRIENGQVLINGAPLEEPYAAFEPIADNPYLDRFPTQTYTDPNVRPGWWKELQQRTQDGELVVPPGKYFMMGDNRNHSLDSRFWGFVDRSQIVARPLVIYFSLTRPSRYDVQQAMDNRLGHESDVSAHIKGFARWKRIFRVVH